MKPAMPICEYGVRHTKDPTCWECMNHNLDAQLSPLAPQKYSPITGCKQFAPGQVTWSGGLDRPATTTS